MATKKQAGYSGTALAAKLGIKAAMRVLVLDAPEGYLGSLDPLPEGVAFVARLSKTTKLIQLFVTSRRELESRLASIRKAMNPEAALWVSWPKQSSGVATDVTEGTVRDVALPMGLVDIKVCAVDETWSGLKLVVRKALR
jgi:hypothetical protein